MGSLARMYGCLFFIKVSEVKRDKHKIILSLLGMGVGTRKGINLEEQDGIRKSMLRRSGKPCKKESG